MLSPFSSPKRSRKESKNPYSNRGLDKFSALLSELDEKRQSIYANRLDSDGPPLVRFVFKSSGECVPVMIKTKKVTKKKVDGQEDDHKIKTESKTKEAKEIKETESETTEKKQRCVLNENLKKISRPNRFLPVTAILVLVFLVFFGRTVSIMCTCIVWYLVPMIKEQSRKKGSTYKTQKKKKKMNERMARDQNVLKEKLPHLSAAPGSFWSVKEKSSLGSWMWKKLLQLRPLALQLTKVEINSGSTTSFWFERWSQLGKLIELTGERGCLMLGIPINSTVERVVQTYRARDHRDPVSRQIEQEIMALRNRGLNQMEDVCLWKRETGYYKEGFLTSQTWEMIRIKSPRVMWHKGIWFQEGTPKFSFITWLAVHDRLATGDRILRWNPRAISSCWLCNSATESRDHLFFECLYSREVWYGTIGDLAGNRSLHRWSQIIQFLANGLHERNLTLLLRYSFQVVLYAVWHERNVRRVGETSPPAACLIARLDKLVRNRITSLRRKNGRKYEKTMEVWFGRR